MKSHKKPFVQGGVDVKYLKTIPLFSSLNRRQMGIILACSQQMSAPEGNAIIHQGQNNYDLYVIIAGKACVSLRHEDGREITLDTLKQGDFFGEMSFLDKKARSATVTALSDTELLVLPGNVFVGALAKFPDIMFKLLQALAGRLRQADERIGTLAFLDVCGRVSRLLVNLAREKGERLSDGRVAIRCPAHRVIADQIGASREAVTKAVKSLVSHGLITVKNREVVIGPKQFEIF